VPALLEDRHAAAAVEAARALMRATGAGSPEGAWIPIGIGVHTGEAFVGALGTGGVTDVTALGDNVNATARLASTARPGEILLSEDT
jgi:adenylate cyclase